MVPTDSRIDLLGKMLDVTSLRHRVIANNVANVNTPGYHQRVVNFEETFAQALARGSVGSALGVQPQVAEGKGATTRADGNNVDIDVEMASLSDNTTLYRTLAQVLATDLAAMRSAISGR